jgi:hypothetical protein
MSYISEHICPDEGWQKYRTLIAERDALRDQLAAARNEALEEAQALCEEQRVKCNDHGQYEAAAFCKTLLIHIDAIKSTTPAPREVTVKEAARMLLADDVNLAKMAEAMHDGPLGADDHWFSAAREAGAFCVDMAREGLRALAHEG